MLSQSVSPELIIIVDDGGATAADLVDLGERGDIRILKTDGYRGASHARNKGASFTVTPFLSFLDDDDFWHRTFLESAYAAVTASNADFAAAGYSHRSPLPLNLELAQCLLGNPGIGGSNLIVRRERFLQVGGFDENLRSFNDTDFLFRLLESGAAFSCVPETLVQVEPAFHFRRRRLTGLSKRRILDEIKFIKKHRRLLELNGVWRARKAGVYMKLFKLARQSGRVSRLFLFRALRTAPAATLQHIRAKIQQRVATRIRRELRTGNEAS